MRTLSDDQRLSVRRYFAELSAERRAERRRVATQADHPTIYYRPRQPDPEYDLPKNCSFEFREYMKAKRMTRLAMLTQAQDGLCYLCDRPFGDGTYRATVDHVVPRSRGGKTLGNVLAAHATCNGLKGSRAPTREELAKLLAVNARMWGMLPASPKALASPPEGFQADMDAVDA